MIGFGSGIFFGQHHRILLEFAEQLLKLYKKRLPFHRVGAGESSNGDFTEQ
jgi:hypothetical protein